MQTNAINWFEIPVVDFERGKRFYETLFAYRMPETMMEGKRMGFLLHQQGAGVGGAIVAGEGYVPSKLGPLVYLNAGDRLDAVLDQVESAGGSIVTPRTAIPPNLGYFGVIVDSEGNRIALHSMN